MTRTSQFGMTRLYERPAPAWHVKALALRREGFNADTIAAKVKRSVSAVRWALDENGERAKSYERVKRARKARAA